MECFPGGSKSGPKGFTMVEIVIILGILVFVSAILLSTFPGFNEGAVLIRTQQEFALALRRAQNISISVAEVAVTLSGGAQTRVVPKKIGIYVSQSSPAQYLIYADLDENGRYSPATDGIIDSVVTLSRGLKFISLKDSGGGEHTAINVTFASPEATITISNDTVSIGEYAEFQILTPNSGTRRSVSVRTSGQIALQ